MVIGQVRATPAFAALDDEPLRLLQVEGRLIVGHQRGLAALSVT